MPQAPTNGTIMTAALIILTCVDIAYTTWQRRRQDREIGSVHTNIDNVRRDVAERYDALSAAMCTPGVAIPAMRNSARNHLRVAKHKEI